MLILIFCLEVDMHLDTPCDILHGILLGPVKYMWREVHKGLSETDKATVERRTVAFNIAGLGIDKINPKQLVRYHGSLVGKDFRVVAQMAPFVLYGLPSLKDALYKAFIYLQQFCALAFAPYIDDMDIYIVSVFLFNIVSSFKYFDFV